MFYCFWLKQKDNLNEKFGTYTFLDKKIIFLFLAKFSQFYLFLKTYFHLLQVILKGQCQEIVIPDFFLA